MNKPYELKCSYQAQPVGIERDDLLFSFKPICVSACQIIISDQKKDMEQETTSANAAVYDTGKIKKPKSPYVKINDFDIQSATTYYWKVRVWDDDGAVSPWSDVASFETGLLSDDDWKGNWIQAPAEFYEGLSDEKAPLLRKSFNLDEDVNEAKLYICGLGYYELTVNGQKVHDTVLNPPFSKFDTRCIYNRYDIAPYLKKGENVMGVILGNGMYNVVHSNPWDFDKAAWRDKPKLMVQGFIKTKDGAEHILKTDPSWSVSAGPILSNSTYVGETYDARCEQKGWDLPGFNDKNWQKAVVSRTPGGQLVSSQINPIRIVETFKPASIREIRQGTWIIDAGRSVAGWLRIRARGEAGTKIAMTFCELLDDKGDLDCTNINRLIRSDFQKDYFILKGEGEETWEPRFTYHGFRYIQLTGYPGTPDLDALDIRVVHTDLKSAGTFACSNDLVNQIQAAALASTLNNYHGMPTDCPHREKNGWTGDALVSSEQVLLNFDPRNAYKKWIDDIMDCQRPSGQLPGIAPTSVWGYNWGSGPAWDSIIAFLPWNTYIYTGDAEIIKKSWPAVKQYLRFADRMSYGDIVDFGLGDWCPPEGGPYGSPTPTALSDTWFYFQDLVIASRMAFILGLTSDQEQYAKKAEAVRKAFIQRFVDNQSGNVTGSCQTSYVLALSGVVQNAALRNKITDRLIEAIAEKAAHIDCGIIGACYIFRVLVDVGRADLAWKIATQTDFPSWGNWIRQGATTLWEMWNGNASHDHHMFSSVSAYFYQFVAGLAPDEKMPGFKRVLFRPQPVDGLDWARASHESPYGKVSIHWQKQPENRISVDLTVPEGCEGRLEAPLGYSISVDDQSLMDLSKQDKDVIELHAGDYQIILTAEK